MPVLGADAPAVEAGRTMANDIYAFTGHANQDVTVTVDGLNRFLSGGGVTYTYDSRGNMTADGVRAYAYDFDNRLTSVTGGGTGNVSLTYDPAGRLYQTAQVSGATTRFLYDGANLIGEYNASNTLLRRYVQGPGLDAPLVRYDGTGTSNRRWLITDERGSVVAETNASGAAVQINTYDEYGMPGSGNTSRFGYTGQMWIAEIGLYHYRNRVYNPRIGRFMQTDPIGQAGGINLYAYVGNDPINYTDPWGLSRIARRCYQMTAHDHLTGKTTDQGVQCFGGGGGGFSTALLWGGGGGGAGGGFFGGGGGGSTGGETGTGGQEGEAACSDIIPDNTNGNPSRRGAARVGSFYGGPTPIERGYERHVAAATAMLERSGHGAAISMWSRMNVVAGSWDMGAQAQYNAQTQTIIINPNLYVNITFAMLHELGHALTMTAWRGTINQHYGGDIDLYTADKEVSGTPAHLFEQRMNDFANCIMSQ